MSEPRGPAASRRWPPLDKASRSWAARQRKEMLRRCPPKGQRLRLAGIHWHLWDQSPPADPARAPQTERVPILLVHGLGAQAGHFTYALQALLVAEGHRVVAVDRPGSGHSRRLSGTTWGLPAQAQQLHALIDHLGLERPWLVGHSLGGAVGLACAVHRPQALSGLVLLAPLTTLPRWLQALPPAFRRLPEHDAAAPAGAEASAGPQRSLAGGPFHRLAPDRLWAPWSPAANAVLGSALAPWMALARPMTLRRIFSPEPIVAEYDEQGGGRLSIEASNLTAAWADLQTLPLDLPRQQRQYPTIRLPVHVLYGRQDAVLEGPHQVAALQAALPSARVEWIDGAGHMLPLTRPQACAAFIRQAIDAATATAA